MRRFIIKCPNKREDRRGFALIGVLWLSILLSVMALGVMALVRSDASIATSMLDVVQAEGLADAGVFLTIYKMLNSNFSQTIPVDGSPIVTSIKDAMIHISVQDESGKIDLNYAPRDVLKSLFVTAGLSEGSVDPVIDAVLLRRQKYFRQNPVSNRDDALVGGRILPFSAVEQVKSIHGVTEDIYRSISPALTIYSRQSVVQASTAPKEVLAALPGLDKSKVADILSRRVASPVTAASIIGEIASSDVNGVVGRIFTIRSISRVGRATFCRHAVIMFPQSGGSYFIMCWEHGDV